MADARTPRFLLYALERGLFWARPGIGYSPWLHQATRYGQEHAQQVSRDSAQFCLWLD